MSSLISIFKNVLVTCVHVCLPQCRCPLRPDEGIRCPGAGVPSSREPPDNGCWESNSDPLEGQQALLTAGHLLFCFTFYMKMVDEKKNFLSKLNAWVTDARTGKSELLKPEGHVAYVTPNHLQLWL